METKLATQQLETLNVYELSRMISKINSTDALNLLECLVDKYGLSAVINDLSNVCGLKADHLADCWDDYDSAKSWMRDAKKLDRLEIEN